MKCPKCGYNSFDYLDSCKKCHKDLTEHKARFNIQSILLSEMPIEAVAAVEEELVAVTANISADHFAGGSEEAADDFRFDFMGDSDDDEDLAFDELFEDVPSEDNLEEALPAPETAATQPGPLDKELVAEEESLDLEEAGIDDSSFDETEPSAPVKQAAAAILDSAADFGFDAEEDPAADIFAETEEDFSLDGIDFEDSDKA